MVAASARDNNNVPPDDHHRCIPSCPVALRAKVSFPLAVIAMLFVASVWLYLSPGVKTINETALAGDRRVFEGKASAAEATIDMSTSGGNGTERSQTGSLARRARAARRRSAAATPQVTARDDRVHATALEPVIPSVQDGRLCGSR